MAVSTYVAESMAYLTAGIMDSYQEPEASLEAAIVKVDIIFYTVSHVNVDDQFDCCIELLCSAKFYNMKTFL